MDMDHVKKTVENAVVITIIGTALFFIFGPGIIVSTVEWLRSMGFN